MIVWLWTLFYDGFRCFCWYIPAETKRKLSDISSFMPYRRVVLIPDRAEKRLESEPVAIRLWSKFATLIYLAKSPSYVPCSS